MMYGFISRIRKFEALSLIFLSLLLGITGNLLFADEPLRPLRTNTPPNIDGYLDDPVWQEAPTVTGLKTWIPDFGHDMAEKTVVFMAYDRENLYFAFRCYDRMPDKIKAAIARRDTIRPDDWVCINLDSFNDQQSLYAFYINPLGIQADSTYAGGQEDHSADLVWYSAGRIDEEGYIAEVQIPLKSIRFANKKTVEMAVLFERRISRRSEQGMYPPLDPKKGYAFLTQMKPMIYHDLKHYRLFEILPAFTYNQKQTNLNGELQAEKALRDFSLTSKYGFSSDLILDATFNPDFSQVESDAGQVDINLRYDLFFVEKRPFFLEGHKNFNFAGVTDLLPSIVHTRTIIDPIAGLKLTGKLGKSNTLASILALDESPRFEEDVDQTGKYALFSILRYKRSLRQDSYIGVLYTGRELKDRYNRVIGPDGLIRITQSSMLGFHLFHSETKPDGQATRKSGNAFCLDYGYDTRKLRINFTLQSLSKDFNTQVGYLTRTGITRVAGAIMPIFYPDTDFVRRFSPNLTLIRAKDHFYNLFEMRNVMSLNFLLFKNLRGVLIYEYSNEVFLAKKFDTSGLAFTMRSQLTKQLSFSSIYMRGNAIYYSGDPYQGKGSSASLSLTYQPLEKLKTEFSLRYADFFRKADSQKIYDYTIIRDKLTYQVNKYLFFRGIVEYNTYRKKMLLDFLASFTYIPGTVIQLGYGSLFERVQWVEGEYRESNKFLEMKRGLFFKVSYLWRL
jgi:hypothetical protein